MSDSSYVNCSVTSNNLSSVLLEDHKR